MATSITDITPFIPSDRILGETSLPDKAISLISQSAKLTGQLAPLTLIRLEQYMAAINSYYSNLIEGNSTRPHEIRAAQTGLIGFCDYMLDTVIDQVTYIGLYC